MKLSVIGLLGVCVVFTVNAMHHESHYGWFAHLANLTAFAMGVPAPGQEASQPVQPAQTPTPGMLQALSNAINKRPGCTN